MPAKASAGNSGGYNRKRNPSRPKKGTVSDIKKAFKKAMEVSDNSSVPNKPTKKSNSKENIEDSDTNVTTLTMNTRSKSVSAGNSLCKESAKDDHDDKACEKPCTQDIEESGSDVFSQDEIQEQASQESINSSDEGEYEQETLNNKLEKGENGEQIVNEPPNNGSTQTVKEKFSNEEIMKALSEIKSSVNKIERTLFDPKAGLETLVAKTISTVRDIKDDISGATGGLKIRMEKAEKEIQVGQNRLQQVETSLTRMSKMLDENKKVAKQLIIMQGMLQKFSQQGQVTNAKVLDLTKRGMEQNLVIYGIEEGNPKEKEDCKSSVISFLRQYLEIEPQLQDIWKAHRMGGSYRPRAVRPMIIKVAYHLKEMIMENVGKLKDQINTTTEKPLFISEQIPEGLIEAKKQTGARLKDLKGEKSKLTEQQKQSIRVQNDKILIDGVIEEPEVQPPQPSDLFIDAGKQKLVDQMYNRTVMTEPESVRNSQFVGLAVCTKSVQEVNLAYTAVAQQFPSMDHIMIAYSLKENDTVKHGHCDDLEHGGGMAIRRVMAEEKAKNTTIFVIRKYGGLHLGLDRFKTIKQVAKKALFLLRQVEG